MVGLYGLGGGEVESNFPASYFRFQCSGCVGTDSNAVSRCLKSFPLSPPKGMPCTAMGNFIQWMSRVSLALGFGGGLGMVIQSEFEEVLMGFLWKCLDYCYSGL